MITDPAQNVEPTPDKTLEFQLKHAHLRLATKHIGYQGGSEFGMHLGESFEVTQTHVDRFEHMGQQFAELLKVTNELIMVALSGSGDTVQPLLESGLTPKARGCHRQYMQACKKAGTTPRLPILFRGDLATLDKAVEFNIPGGGFGIIQALNESFKISTQLTGRTIAEGYFQGLQFLSKKRNPKVALPLYSGSSQEDLFMANSLRELGADVVTYSNRIPNGKFDIIIRYSLNRAVECSGWDKAFKSFQEERVQIEPPPNAAYDSKIPNLLAFHPETKDFYTEEMRDCFPETWLVGSGGVIGQNGSSVEISALSSLPRRQRAFILKYAGAESEDACGGANVFQLDGKWRVDHRFGVNTLVERAIDDWRSEGRPWIVQDRLRHKFPVKFLDGKKVVEENRYARISPYYSVFGDEVAVIGGGVVLNKGWKAHGAFDAVQSAMILSKG